MSDAVKMLDKIRGLDIDDLIVLSLLYEDYRGSEISKILYLTQPAITHRLNKCRVIFGDEIFVKFEQRRILSPYGREIAEKAKTALGLFLPISGTFKEFLTKTIAIQD